MLVPYQQPQCGILIILQMVCKKNMKNNGKDKRRGKYLQLPFPSTMRNVIMIFKKFLK
jgi:hypothetical protein